MLILIWNHHNRHTSQAAPVKKEEQPVTGRDAFLAQIRMTRQNKNLKKVFIVYFIPTYAQLNHSY